MMDVYALFDDGSAEKVEFDLLTPKNDDDCINIEFYYDVPGNIRISLDRGIRKSYLLLVKSYVNQLPEKISIWYSGFERNVQGNSADLSFAVSFLSYCFDQGFVKSARVPSKVFATGILKKDSLNVQGITGLREKVIAAARECNESGENIIMYPEENQQDLDSYRLQYDDFEELVSNANLKLVPVKNLKDVLAYLGIEELTSRNQPGNTASHITKKILVPIMLIMFLALFTAGYVYWSRIGSSETVSTSDPQNIEHFSSPPFVSPEQTDAGSSVHAASISASADISGSTATASSPVSGNTSIVPSEEGALTPAAAKPSSTSSSNKASTGISRTTLPNLTPTPVRRTRSTATPVSKSLVHTDLGVVNSLGNSPSNIVNNGLASVQGNRFYYSSNGIFQSVPGAVSDGQISSNSASSINIIGSWLYYINGNDSNRPYKINLNTKEYVKLHTDSLVNMLVTGDWIYYLNAMDNRIYRIDTKGFDRTLVCENTTECFQVSTSRLGYIENHGPLYWIYYINTNDGNTIYRIKSNGTGNQQICSDHAGKMIAEGDWIYYTNTDDNNSIYKTSINNNATSGIKVSSAAPVSFTVYGNWLYYSNSTGLHKLNIISKIVSPINQSCDGAENLCYVNGWLYFTNINDNNRLYKIMINGDGLNALGSN